MKKRETLIACLVICLSAIIFSACARRPSEPETKLQIGLAAPAFKLPDLSGQEVTLDQYKGKVVMLDFWATWCGPCRMTMPILESMEKEFANNLILLAVNVQESKDDVRDFVRAQNVHSRVLLDEEGSVGETYGTESIPMQVLIDKRGIIRHIQIGFGPRTASELRSQIQKLIQQAS